MPLLITQFNEELENFVLLFFVWASVGLLQVAGVLYFDQFLLTIEVAEEDLLPRIFLQGLSEILESLFELF